MYHRIVAVVLSGTLTLLNHAIECIILVVGIFVVCCLYTILREDQAGFIVVLVADACCTRQLLPTAFIERILILVLKSIFVQICFFLILGLKHIADITQVIVHIIGIQIFATHHLTLQQEDTKRGCAIWYNLIINSKTD